MLIGSACIFLSLCTIQTDNEENVLVCLRIIIELHKQYRPQMNKDVSSFIFITPVTCLFYYNSLSLIFVIVILDNGVPKICEGDIQRLAKPSQ